MTRVYHDQYPLNPNYVPQVKEEINKLTHPNCGHFQVEWQGHGILVICQPQCSRNYIFSLFFTNSILDETMNLYFLYGFDSLYITKFACHINIRRTFNSSSSGEHSSWLS